MYCWQCEQTLNGTGCVKSGVCGKTAETAALSDLLMYALKGLAWAAARARREGRPDLEADRCLTRGLFATLTNVDFDPNSLSALIDQAVELRDRLKVPADAPTAATFKPAGSLAGRVAQGEAHGFRDGPTPQILSLRETAVYGLKGLAAYVHHAAALGREDDELHAFVEELLAQTLDPSLGLEAWLAAALKVGEKNLRAMELLDEANLAAFGVPTPTKVSLGWRAGPAVCVSGHDLNDLAQLLAQVRGRGVNVHTHVEMLPAHAYPGLQDPQLVGHWGTGWHNQTKELADFPGPTLFTSNCLQKPAAVERVFVTGPTAWPGARRIEAGPDGRKDFGPVIDQALALGGFQSAQEGPSVLTGFNWRTVLGAADQVVDLVKRGRIKRFILIGGCDGARGSRSYYRELALKAPQDAMILTLACGKFRFFDLDLGDIEGLPRLMDLGQCNDAHSAVKIAAALAEAFGVPLDELPLSLALSWYEQKACAILLSLLHLGLKNIRLGPSLPAFVHPDVLAALVDKWGLKPTGDPEDDLREIMAGR
ncbi:MAG: hydroxylamine reductase [Deltaproteobacteria bacterium]|jgi:hydroxylamine reductase|nr:hydroxylamine reductase [Deltaproteobacteria bacterium]